MTMKGSCSQKVHIGVADPTFYNLSDGFLPDWTGFKGLPCTEPAGNYLCAFTLGWSYILLARLVELRKQTGKDMILYTDEKATWQSTGQALSSDHFVIPIGNADLAECRWWAAILAKGRGW